MMRSLALTLCAMICASCAGAPDPPSQDLSKQAISPGPLARYIPPKPERPHKITAFVEKDPGWTDEKPIVRIGYRYNGPKESVQMRMPAYSAEHDSRDKSSVMLSVKTNGIRAQHNNISAMKFCGLFGYRTIRKDETEWVRVEIKPCFGFHKDWKTLEFRPRIKGTPHSFYVITLEPLVVVRGEQ